MKPQARYTSFDQGIQQEAAFGFDLNNFSVARQLRMDPIIFNSQTRSNASNA
jgi:hypothetical protein